MYLSVYVQYMICFNLCFFQRELFEANDSNKYIRLEKLSQRSSRCFGWISRSGRNSCFLLLDGKLSNEELATFREETTLRPWKIAKLASQTFRSMGIADVRALLLPADPPPAALPRTGWSNLAITRAEIFMELYNLIESHSSSNFELWENISRASIY